MADELQSLSAADPRGLLRLLDRTAAKIPAHTDRTGDFTRLSADAARGDVITVPSQLQGRRRRLHIRNTVTEDHRARLRVAPDAVAGSVEHLAEDAYSFFRGTALLYYRDLVGEDAWLPSVPSVGDVHPENFGVLPGADGQPVFSADHLDEAWPAPFTWDVHRGAVGFALLAGSRDLPERKWWKLARTFLEGYVTGVDDCLPDPTSVTTSLTAQDAPSCLEPFFRRAQRSREKFLKKWIDLETCTFLETDQVTRQSGAAALLRPLIEKYARRIDTAGLPENFFGIRDVATRTGSGAAGPGLPRFRVLVEGHGPDAGEKVILELTLSRRSALQGLVPKDPDIPLSHAERTARAFRAFVADGDPLYGHVNAGGLTFLAHEHSPMTVPVDTGGFSWSQLKEYAELCGRQTAHLHGRSGAAEDPAVIRTIAGQVRREVFLTDGEEFTRGTVARILEDHRMFREDVAAGAFRPLRPVTR